MRIITRCVTRAGIAWLVLASSAGHAAPVPGDPVQPEAFQDYTVETGNSRLARALKLLNAGEPAQGEALAREVLTSQPRLAAAHEVLGAALALQGELEEAAAALQRAVELNPGQATAHTKLGDIALAQGDVPAAVKHFEAAVAADSTERLAHQRLGLHYEGLGRSELAIRHFESGVIGTPADYLGVKLNLSRLYVAEGRLDDAIELLRPWSDDLDARAEVHRVLGIAHYSAGDLPSAIRHLQAAVKLNPADTATFALLGEAIRQSADPESGISVYEELISGGDAAIGVYGELGMLLQGEGEFERAERVYREMVERFPERTEGYFLLGAFYGFRTQYDDAYEVYQRGLEVAPDNAGLLRGASASELRRGNAESSLALALRLQKASQDIAGDAFNRGLIYERLEAADRAEQSYREAIELQPEHWPSLNNLAVILLRSGRPGEGLALAERAASLAGNNPLVLHTLGWAQLEQGQLSEAVTSLKRALEIDPDAPTFNYRLGRAYLAQGDVSRGLDRIRRALDLDPDFSDAADARALLER